MNEHTALLLVDLQRDFINEDLLMPPVGVLVEQVKALLTHCRAAGIPVFHTRTLVNADGAGRMPHWQRNGDQRCVKGTPGAQPPEGLESLPGEIVYNKSFYSAFGNPSLDNDLRQAGIQTLLVAGLHTHACVQATVLDAYQLGYTVKLISDAVASYSPLHADLTMRHLMGRACQCVTVAEVFPVSLPGLSRDECGICVTHPVSFIGGNWESASGHRLWEMRDPCEWNRVVANVPIAGSEEVKRAASLSCAFQSEWADRSDNERLDFLQAWEAVMKCRQAQCVELLISEVGKPRKEATAEFDYTLSLLNGILKAAAREAEDYLPAEVKVRYRPRGVIAVITPWNNPLALPVSKLAAALVYGNTVVWKPALQSPALVRMLVSTLVEAGLPANGVNVTLGDAETARLLLRCPEVAAVSFTGSEDAGREISSWCGLRGIPLQAELGGNNAVLVAEDVDIARVARDLAPAVFSFSGQRCTAPRRLIIADQIFDEFSAAMIEVVGALKVGRPGDSDTHLGPLISRDRQDLMIQRVRFAIGNGARLLAGGNVPEALAHGCWFEPTLLTDVTPSSALVCEETFGPLAVLLKAKNFDHGISLCNGVRQGLRAILYSESDSAQDQFVKRAQAGMIYLNKAATYVSADAPFLGWKSSGMGLPEHGRWDRDFYTRVQAVYGER